MAKVYMRTPKIVAQHADVQDELERRTFEVAVRAEQLLIQHRQDGHAEIDIEHGDIDYYVVLSDERGQKAALSIEYGREAGEYEVRDPETGEMVTVEYGAMEGLFILAQASHLPKKRKGKVDLD
ncbi:hypothetical protein SEA_JANUS_14 [Streptomyces phage Janus]|uniref:Uncharacterized protein n=1 Tax=Streptomyces phage Janus TaxID=2510525 RepID=A0A411CPQ4_9CAUD|nr:tail completion or Neck1 protein [Streptomyces phage Janus]ATI18877.1 hypothetical protein SEA_SQUEAKYCLEAN_14 [Streptomyces phage SqueakyClean]QAY15918.1 hypothetical protein SEA_JANUS_14 [Streptomyces phage Janus]QFG10682.1 hypothetical protein SEA_ANIMUS_14 [Streptomyces phage Animus]